jgi:Trypsin-co-occurring domain 1
VSAELVRIGDVEFFVEVSDGGGAQNVGVGDILSFDGVRDTVRAIGTELGGALRGLAISEASVEFGVSMSAKSGRLTGLIVEGDATASLKVMLTWQPATAAEGSARGE